jgi:hypothetical protein
MIKALIKLKTSSNFGWWYIIFSGQLSFLAQLPNTDGFGIIKFRSSSNLNFIQILKGSKLFGKNSINSPKIFLDMIFNTVNLDWPTCIKNFEVPIQVANRA